MNTQIIFNDGNRIAVTGAATANTSSLTIGLKSPIAITTGSVYTLTANDQTLIVGSFVNSVVTLPQLSGSGIQDGTMFIVKNQGSNTCTISASHDTINPGTVGSSDHYTLLSGKFVMLQSMVANGWYSVANS